jgi:hypothetical protein
VGEKLQVGLNVEHLFKVCGVESYAELVGPVEDFEDAVGLDLLDDLACPPRAYAVGVREELKKAPGPRMSRPGEGGAPAIHASPPGPRGSVGVWRKSHTSLLQKARMWRAIRLRAHGSSESFTWAGTKPGGRRCGGRRASLCDV